MRFSYFLITIFIITINSIGKCSDLTEKQKLQLEISNFPNKNDTNYVILLNKLAFVYETEANDSCLIFAQQAFEQAKKMNYINGIITAYTHIGSFYNAKGNYNISLKVYIEKLNFAEKFGTQKHLCNAYNELGNCYLGIEKNEIALENYLKGLEVAEENGFNYLIGILNIGIGNCYANMGGHQLSYQHYFKSKEIFEFENTPYPIAVSYTLIGNALAEMGNYKESFEYLNLALEIFQDLDNAYGIGSNYDLQAETYLKMGEHNKAIPYFLKSYEIFKERNAYFNLKAITLGLSTAYKETNNFEKAYLYLNEHIIYKDSVLNADINQQLLDIETKYEVEKNKNELFSKNIEINNQKATLKQQETTLYYLIFIVGFILLILILIFRGYRLKQKTNKFLANANSNLGIKNQIIEQKNKEILDSINYAKRIQTAILPSENRMNQFLEENFVLYMPKDIVAGDFYWLETITDSNTILLAAADCTGHGVPGAMVSVVCHNALDRAVKEYNLTKPSEILDKTREIVINEFQKSDEEVKDGMDISLVALQQVNRVRAESESVIQSEKQSENEEKNAFHSHSFSVSWSGANNPLWIIRNGELIEFKPDKQPIGKHVDMKPFTNYEFEIQKGDMLYLLTDGFADQFGGENQKTNSSNKFNGKKFKKANLKSLLVSLSSNSLANQKEKLSEVFNTWKGDFEQVDDVCIIGVRL